MKMLDLLTEGKNDKKMRVDDLRFRIIDAETKHPKRGDVHPSCFDTALSCLENRWALDDISAREFSGILPRYFSGKEISFFQDLMLNKTDWMKK